MKAVHHSIEKGSLSLIQWLAAARELESDDHDMAIKEYKRITLAHPVSEKAYDRLMILFRQKKRPKDEIYWIDKAMEVFEKHFHKRNKPVHAVIAKLSRSIAKSTGLSDKKGNSAYQPAPIAKWQKRKDLLLKKMK